MIEKSDVKCAGICVIPHDGFAMWDSDVSSWNAGDRGPKRDRGLKTIATFHHRRTFNWYLPRNKKHRQEILQSGEYDLTDPKYKYLYWNESTSTREEFLKQWDAKVREVMDKYSPDVVWFDGGDFEGEGPGGRRGGKDFSQPK